MIERVAVVGAGLIGTSIALALREHDVDVAITDRDPAVLRLALDLGAGRELAARAPERPADVAVLAAPPTAIPGLLREAQERRLARVYTDVGSVKSWIVAEAHRIGCDLADFVPGHPMGGREKAGPGAARADLFLGRSWALCPTGKTEPAAVGEVVELAGLCGANPVRLDAEDHDSAVALVSHTPHVAASAVAARLLDVDQTALALAGQGVRDVTRVAGGDPGMWVEILRHNATRVADALEVVATDLARTAKALRAEAGSPEAEAVHDMLERGRRGRERIPGKHGAGTPDFTMLPVVIPDEPNALARLLAAAGEAGINIEDVRLDHSPGLPVAVAQLSVRPEAITDLARALAEGGWSVHP